MKSTTLILSLAVIAAGAASSMAHSEDQQDHNLAVGFMLGKSTSNYDSGSYSGTPEGKDKSGGLFVEYDFSKHFGVQAAVAAAVASAPPTTVRTFARSSNRRWPSLRIS